MASGSVIGALRVILGADTAQFETGLKTAQTSLDRFSMGTKLKIAAFATAIASVAMGLGIAVVKSMDHADKLGKMAQSYGIPVEELSKLELAAELSDVSLESLGKALGRLSRNMVDAAQGSAQQVEAFKMLGIEVRNTDGTLKTVSQVLPQIADKFKAMADGPEQTALALKLFGRAGAEMIPMLNEGSAGMTNLMNTAQALGLVITDDVAKAADVFGDNLQLIGKVQQGLINQITVQMAPALANLSGVLLQAARDEKFMAEAGNVLAGTFKTLVSAGIIVGAVFKVLFSAIRSVANAIMFIVEGEFKKAYESLKTGFDDYKTTIDGATKMVEGIWATHGNAMAAEATKLGDAMNRPIVENLKERKAAEKAALDESKRNIKAWEEAHRQANQIFEETRTPMEKFKLDLAELNGLFERGHLSVETYNRALFKLQMDASGIGDMMKSVGSSLESAFVDAIVEGKKMSEVAQDLLKDLARLAAQAAFRALLGNVFGGGGGMSMFGNIPKFARGGSFEVGGVGSVDSKLVAFMASPGERVNVTKPGQDSGGGMMIVNTYHQDFRGVDQTSRAYVAAQIRASEQRAVARAPGEVSRHRSNNPNYLRGAM